MKPYNLKNKYAIVTGASSGIGKEISLCLAKEGTHMVLGCLPSEKDVLGKWAQNLETKYSIKTWIAPLDLSDENAPQMLFEKTKKCVPHLDVLINNAGIGFYGPFHEVPLDDLLKLLYVNTRACMVLMRLALPEMISRKQGRILNVCSLAAFQPTPFEAAYAAGKVFLKNLSEASNHELRGTGVQVHALYPGMTDTPIIECFPKEINYFKFCVVRDPQTTAQKAIKALKAGKQSCIIGVENWIEARLLPHLVPRRWAPYVAYSLLKRKKTN